MSGAALVVISTGKKTTRLPPSFKESRTTERMEKLQVTFLFSLPCYTDGLRFGY